MTLEELKKEYTLNQAGLITNPGKFEGESLATPFYYDIMLNGEGDVIEIESSDRLAFEIEDIYNYVVVIESSDGFVSLFWCETKEEAKKESNNQYIMDSIDLDDWDD